jgi:hypothetical protein
MIELKSLIKEVYFTPEFKAWFGNSVIKDKDGYPIPMYHGTKEKNLTKFSRSTFQKNEPLRGGEGFYFTDGKDYAVNYAINHKDPYDPNAHLDPEVLKRVGEYYLSLENPAPKEIVDAWRSKIYNEEQDLFYKLKRERGKDADFTDEDRRKVYDIVRYWSRKMREFLESKGYDGYAAVGQIPDNMAEIVVFHPNQIKSTSNVGTYDIGSDDVFKENIEDYRGVHHAPGKDNGAPLYDLTKIYPDDIYGPDAIRCYGSGYDMLDKVSMYILHAAKGRPNKQIRIYRAVPTIVTNQDKINDLEKQKAYILKYGKLPPATHTKHNRSDYYEIISNELEKLKALPLEPSKSIQINPGDWVTINKEYAKEHGESTLLGRYKIISKVVPAKTLFTTADSIHEWGYDP